MTYERPVSLTQRVAVLAGALLLVVLVGGWAVSGDEKKNDASQHGPVRNEAASSQTRGADATQELDEAFKKRVQPFLTKHCVRCHNADEMQSGIRVDQLTAVIEDRHIPLWKGIQKQIAGGAMPPEDEPQPRADERKLIDDWASKSIAAALSRNTRMNGAVRRLTVAQYRNTLRDLLGLREDLTDALPPDGTSKDGFTNNAHLLALSPLQVETYFDIARKSLDLCIVDEDSKPVIQNFRMELGDAINPQPCPDKLILGALSMLLDNDDFIVTEPKPAKPFAFEPFAMRTKYEFIEGYQGNDTVRGWRKYDSIYHSVFACVRGTPGYPKGEPYDAAPSGLLLRPAIPSPEIFGQSNTYGPMANFKISLRELPFEGNFQVRVKAARYDDGLLLDAETQPMAIEDTATVFGDLSKSAEVTVAIPKPGIYQVDLHGMAGKSPEKLSLQLGERRFTGKLNERQHKETKPDAPAGMRGAFVLVRLPAGELKVVARYGDNSRLRRIVFTPLKEDSEAARRFSLFEKRAPSVGVHVGLRRDCGSTLTPVGEPQAVSNGELREFLFEGAINDFPTPDVEKDNVNYLAGIREIGVRCEYTDGRDTPRLMIRSIEFEGPFYESWPPETHRRIFIDSPQRGETQAYAREIIRSFATRAFRRPVTDAEVGTFVAVWKDAFNQHDAPASGSESEKINHLPALRARFNQSIKDALLVVLTSPQFLFLIENSVTPEAEDLDPYELASKLSYFLWNAPPDQRLLELAATNKLHAALNDEIDRMIRDPRFGQFISEFGSQWLSLDKFDVVAVDAKRYPKLTRDTKTELRKEPIQFLRYLLEENRPLRDLIDSDFVVANEVTASYYDLADRTESGFRFVPIKHDNANLGGVLTQASILSGLSDGRESNPVKRGAWFARRIIAEPPDDPPPNVPKLPEDDASKLTLREKLERHRNQKGCVKCHSGIDPWGLPFESFDASGLLKKEPNSDTHSKLPDGAEVADLNGLKRHLTQDRLDQVAFSMVKHLAVYATGRSLTYREQMEFRAQVVQLREAEYRMHDLLRFVIGSDAFLKK